MSEDREARASAGAAAGPERTPLARAMLLIPNAMTLCAILCGITAIRWAAEGHFALVMLAIFAAAALDTGDGYVARALGAESQIGAELDSLADFVNFGVAPAMLIYDRELRLLGEAGWIIAGIYVLATGLRLARFNVQSRLPKKPERKKYFTGLPSTGAALAVVILDAGVNAVVPGLAAALMGTLALAAAALMVSTVPVPALFKR
jgi:CDP-diacylglycerol---serine O-phosphatidyltransferase